MRWTTLNIVSGMQSLLSKSSDQDPQDPKNALADIRQVMLDELAIRAYKSHPAVQMRVSGAADIQDLWYLRGDLMAIIAASDGEAAARLKMTQISSMFKGLLPRALSSRPSPLGE